MRASLNWNPAQIKRLRGGRALLTSVCVDCMCVCVMKRTTLILEDSCMKAVRDLAQHENRQMSQVVNELLAEGLQRRRSCKAASFELPTFHMGRPKVNLSDRNALEALMDS